MNLIICHTHDLEAHWLFQELKKNDHDIELISPEEILLSLEWTQHLTTKGDSFYLKLGSGKVIEKNNLNFVFNRITTLNPYHWQKAPKEEFQYVYQELNAFLLSWLYLASNSSKMMNPPACQNFSGTTLSDPEWQLLAHSVGLQTSTSDSSEKVQNTISEKINMLVVNEKVLMPIKSKEIAKKCIELSKLVNTPLLELTFFQHGKEYFFENATPMPTLKKYGNNLISAIISNLNHN